MRRLLFLLFLIGFSASAQTFTEFYCDATVSANNTNINAGSTAGAPIYTTVNGNWDGTSIFTPTDGSTPASSVTNGSWVSVYTDNQTNLVQTGITGGWIVLVTNVAAGANGAITVDRGAFSGTAPTSSANARSLRMGGCWRGPYASLPFPFGFIAQTATNGSGYITRVNFKNAQKYVIAANLPHSLVGPCVFQGYSSSIGDGGRFVIDGNTGNFNLLTFSGNGGRVLSDCVLTNAATVGSAFCVTIAVGDVAINCLVVGARGNGYTLNGSAYQCEAQNCGRNGTGGNGGFSCGVGSYAERCISSNATTAASGFVVGAQAALVRCIASFNGRHGILVTAGGGINVYHCDFLSNGGSGIVTETATDQTLVIENCNFFSNTGYAISNRFALVNGLISNCNMGSGGVANAAGTIFNQAGIFTNTIYSSASLPWVDGANGNFSIATGNSKGTGIGTFYTSSTIGSATVSYPDIGAAQASDTNAATAGGSYTFSQ